MAGTEQAQVKFPMGQLKKTSISSLLGLPLLWLRKAYFNTKVSLGKSPVPHCCGGDCLFCGSVISCLLMIREVHVLCSVVNQEFIVFARELIIDTKWQYVLEGENRRPSNAQGYTID